MEPLTIREILKMTGGSLDKGEKDTVLERICRDSRQVKGGDLFVALKGDRFDGHDFLEEVDTRGAAAALVEKGADLPPLSLPLISVEDTLLALGDLARHYRRRFDLPLVAITGSNGKTTTKEMIGYVLSGVGKTIASKGNYNNEIGVPLSLLEIDSQTEYAAIEMGANQRGDIAYLTQMASPQIGVITNIGAAHLEGFGTLEGVQKAKGELADELPSTGLLIVNGDDPRCREIARGFSGEVVTFGLSHQVHIRGKILSMSPRGLHLEVEGEKFHIPLLGRHNAYNTLAAVAVGRALGFFPYTYTRWEEFRPPSLRMETHSIDGVDIVQDSYNANPLSVEKALSTLANFPTPGRKILVLGDMLELGEKSARFHRQMAEMAWKCGFYMALSIGEESLAFHQRFSELGGRSYRPESHEVAARFLAEYTTIRDVVLIKGSRGMEMEKIGHFWQERKRKKTA